MAILPLGPYRPDAPETNGGVSANIVNVVAIRDELGLAYAPSRDIAVVASATAIPASPKGGVSVIDRAGNNFAYVGTQSTIQRFNAGGTWTAIGTGYNLTATHRWSMVPYGNFLLATNTTDGLLQYNVETGGAVTAVANSYAPRVLFVAFNCVFGGDTLDASAVRDNRLLRNSAINDYSVWTPGINGAGAQPLPDGEEIVGGAELSDGFAVLVQRNALRALVRTSDSSIYSMQLIAFGTGAVNPYCIAAINGTLYFCDTDGFKSFSQSTGLRIIGDGKVNRSIIANMGATGLDNIEAAIDPVNQRIVWRYISATNGSQTVAGNCIAYSYALDEFVPLEVSTQAIFSLATPSYDMDNMSAAWPDMDNPLMPDLDSRYWVGKEPQLFGIDANGKGGFFSGQTLEARLETYTQALPTAGLVTELKVVTDASAALVSLAGRDALNAPKVYGSEFPMQTSGVTKTRARGKNLTVKIRIPAGSTWSYIRGVDDVRLVPVGSR